MTETPALPAGWAPSTEVLGAQWAVYDPDVQQVALQWSVQTLWALSGRQFGVQDVTVAPWVPTGRPGVPLPPGRVLSAGAGFAPYRPGATGPARVVRLPGPVLAVAAVVIDAAVVTDWVLDPDGTLVRTGGGAWPVAQDVYDPRWTVRYTRGRVVPAAGNLAAARYAVELAKGLSAAPVNKMQGRVRDVGRSAMAVTPQDATDPANAGLTGVPLVDDWLRAVNPDRRASGPVVWSPDVSRHRLIEVHP